MCIIFHCIWETIVISALQVGLDFEFTHIGNKLVVGLKGECKKLKQKFKNMYFWLGKKSDPFRKFQIASAKLVLL